MLYLLSHYRTFVLIISCYLTPSLAVFRSCLSETILILDIEIEQGILNIVELSYCNGKSINKK